MSDPTLLTEGILTESEKIVLKLICKDKRTKEIAKEMRRNTRTIESMRQNLYKKTGAKTVAGLVSYAITTKLVDLFAE